MLLDTVISDSVLVSAYNANEKSEYRIRRMLYNDIEKIVAIEKKTWGDESWCFDEFLKCIYDPTWNNWIIESSNYGNTILGYGLQYTIGQQSHIANLCIDPDERGRGLGNILLRHMTDYARRFGCLTVTLEVKTTNIAAYNLYYKHGFRTISRLIQYYANDSDAYEMELILNYN